MVLGDKVHDPLTGCASISAPAGARVNNRCCFSKKGPKLLHVI